MDAWNCVCQPMNVGQADARKKLLFLLVLISLIIFLLLNTLTYLLTHTHTYIYIFRLYIMSKNYRFICIHWPHS